MRIRKTKGKDKFKLDATGAEMRTLTIALANLGFVDFEDDAIEHGLTKKEVSMEHIKLFNEFSKITGMYSSEEVVKDEETLEEWA